MKKDIFNPMEWVNENRDEQRQTKNDTVKCSGINFSDMDDMWERVNQLVQIVVDKSIDLTNDYNDWLKIGFALAGQFDESGRQLFHELSKMNIEKYNERECDKKYDNYLRSADKNKVNIGTLFWLAGEHGIDLSELARQSMRESATSAIMPSGTIMAENKNINNNQSDNNKSGIDMADGRLADMAEEVIPRMTHYTFSDKLDVNNLPQIIQKIYDIHKDEPAKCDAMILASLNVISGIMGIANGNADNKSGVYGIYDRRTVYAPLYNIIYSSAGNDKGGLLCCKKIAENIENEYRSKYIDELQKYNDDMTEFNAKKSKKEQVEVPKKPIYRNPFVPANSSSSAVYHALENNGSSGMMFETEADVVTNMLNSDYGNYSTLMRGAHHHEPLTLNRVTDDVHIDIKEPKLSVFLTCTPGQLPGLFPSFENGLGSRFLFYSIPDDDVVFHDVFASDDKPLDETFKGISNDIMPLYHELKSRIKNPIQFLLSKEQQNKFLKTYQDALTEQFNMLGNGIRAFIFRLALECFRYSMILSTLRKLDESNERVATSDADKKAIFEENERGLVCDDRDFDTAMTITGCLIDQTARVYAVIGKEEKNPFSKKGFSPVGKERLIYNQLPDDEFRTCDFLNIAMQNGVSERTAHRILGRFKSEYEIIIQLSMGHFKKKDLSDE